MTTLNASARTAGGTNAAEEVRKAGRVPAVVYGPKQEAISISVALPEFEALLRHGGESSLIELTGLDKPLQVLIHDLVRNPVTSVPIHADFYAVEKGAKIEISVPISFIGESAAVKQGASLVKVLHELDIEAAPDKLPHEIEVDISALVEMGDQIHVSDIVAPTGVVIMTAGEEVIVLVQAVEVEAEEPSAGPDMSAIEVEK